MAPTTNNKPCAQHRDIWWPSKAHQPVTVTPGARFNKEVQPTLSLNLNSELSYSEMGNSEFSVTEQLNCVSLLNSK